MEIKSPIKKEAPAQEQPKQPEVKAETLVELEARLRAEIGAKLRAEMSAVAAATDAQPAPVNGKDARHVGENPLPKGFVIPAKAVKVSADERGQVRVDY